MGTVGLGLVARDLRDRTWSRYDVKSGVLPGIHSFVFYADDEYVFAKAEDQAATGRSGAAAGRT